jgi:hypothetical protein
VWGAEARRRPQRWQKKAPVSSGAGCSIGARSGSDRGSVHLPGIDRTLGVNGWLTAAGPAPGAAATRGAQRPGQGHRYRSGRRRSAAWRNARRSARRQMLWVRTRMPMRATATMPRRRGSARPWSRCEPCLWCTSCGVIGPSPLAPVTWPTPPQRVGSLPKANADAALAREEAIATAPSRSGQPGARSGRRPRLAGAPAAHDQGYC